MKDAKGLEMAFRLSIRGAKACLIHRHQGSGLAKEHAKGCDDCVEILVANLMDVWKQHEIEHQGEEYGGSP